MENSGKRLVICGKCPNHEEEYSCRRTWHTCLIGHYEDQTRLPTDGECPDFPKPEDKVPGEVLETAKRIKERISDPARL